MTKRGKARGIGLPVVASVLRGFVRYGTLRVAVGGEAEWEFVGLEPGPIVGIWLRDRHTLLSCALNPALRVGEAYMDGRLRVEEGTLAEFLELALLNTRPVESTRLQYAVGLVRWARSLLRLLERGRGTRRNVAHHYDLKKELFELFLDSDHQYSCAYFTSPDDDLETAQQRKKVRLAAKLLLEPGHKVLDIGSGWGGLALYLAGVENVEVDGVTLSEKQYEASRSRAAATRLSDRVRFHLKDYREVEGKYERIISVGMLEHVGRRHYREYFRKIADLLTEDGVALVHCIGRFRESGARHPWIEKYIFPGNYLPSLAVVLKYIEQTSLMVTDVEILRLHYAQTLKAWRERFAANSPMIRKLYDERFIRMWELYLTGCEMVFRTGQAMVFQIQLSRSLATVPITRGYIAEYERDREPATRATGTHAVA